MPITVRGKNIEVTTALREYVEKRLGKLEKFFDMPLNAQATLSVERGRHIVEVTVPLNGMYIRGEEETGDMYSSIDLVFEKLEKQVEKYKTRITRRIRPQEKQIDLPEEEDEPKVVKVKRFAIKPINVREAIMEMNLLGHDFFVFTNSETDRVCVIYRRKDGNYGLIEPEVG